MTDQNQNNHNQIINDPASTSGVINAGSRQNISLAGLPVFSGKQGENIKEFFAKITQRAIIDGWLEHQTIAVVKYQLTGTAFELLESEEALRDPDITFKCIENFFIQKYTKKVIPGQGALKVNKCVQNHKETVGDYATRLKIVGRDLLQENLNSIDSTNTADIKATKKRHEKDLIQQFQRGLNADIAKMIMLEFHRNPTRTFEETVELAEQAEISHEILQQPKRQNEWRVYKTEERHGRMSPRNSYSNEGDNSRKNKCFKCQKEGHIAKDCRTYEKCYYCGRMGHRQRECRQRLNNNNRPPNERPTTSNHANKNAKNVQKKSHLNY